MSRNYQQHPELYPSVALIDPYAPYLRSMNDTLNEGRIDAPYSRMRDSKLGDYVSTTVRLSLDDPEKWPNHIYENSRYATFIWHHSDNKMQLISCGLGMPRKFRMQKCDTYDMFCIKINKYLNSK